VKLRLFILMIVAALLTTSLAAAQDTETPECAPGQRLFTHKVLWKETPGGAVCIPENPQRIAYSMPFHIPAMLRGGIPLIAIDDRAYLIHEFPEWEAVFNGIADIGLPLNLEATLALAPDLIIEPSWAAAENYDEVSQIAPTVAFQFDGTHQWKELAQMFFEIVGKQDEYDALMAEYEARADELGELIGNPEDIELSLVALWGENRTYTNFSPGGMILEDVGFSRPAVQIVNETPEEVLASGAYPFFYPLNWENIQDAEGDFIIAFGDFDTEEGGKILDEVTAQPLWQALNAVKQGNVYYSRMNWAGGDIAAAHTILDDIAEAFGVADQLSPNPYKTVPEELLPAES
jgi:iron complex transport system substrate-binding protein